MPKLPGIALKGYRRVAPTAADAPARMADGANGFADGNRCAESPSVLRGGQIPPELGPAMSVSCPRRRRAPANWTGE